MLCTDRLLGCLQFKPDPYPHDHTSSSYDELERSEATAGEDPLEAILREPGSATLTSDGFAGEEILPEEMINPEDVLLEEPGTSTTATPDDFAEETLCDESSESTLGGSFSRQCTSINLVKGLYIGRGGHSCALKFVARVSDAGEYTFESTWLPGFFLAVDDKIDYGRPFLAQMYGASFQDFRLRFEIFASAREL